LTRSGGNQRKRERERVKEIKTEELKAEEREREGEEGQEREREGKEGQLIQEATEVSVMALAMACGRSLKNERER
jgi:hypothetical protein